MERDKPDDGKRAALFSDIDGTLAFCEGIHGLQFVRSNDDGTVLVSTDGSKTYKGYRIPGQKKQAPGIFVDEETMELGHKLSEHYDWFFVTGAGLDSLRKRARVLDFAYGYVLENGGLILDDKLREDADWSARIAYQVAYLPDIAQRLERQGWVPDLGRRGSIRLRPENNPKKNVEDFKQVRSDIRKDRRVHGLKVTDNLGYTDIIPKNAGKGNAIDYIVKKYGYEPQNTVGIGDDVNDISLLEHVAHAHVLKSGHKKVVETARERGWDVSTKMYVDGINDILKKLLQVQS